MDDKTFIEIDDDGAEIEIDVSLISDDNGGNHLVINDGCGEISLSEKTMQKK